MSIKEKLYKSLMRHFDKEDVVRCEIKEVVRDSDFSTMDNAIVEITEEDISALREGKVLTYDNCDSVHFIIMR